MATDEERTEIHGSVSGETIPPANFAVAIYRGCVLPEDYKPARIISWELWCSENPDDYSIEQLTLIRLRLMAGRSWVCFAKQLETIAAPDYYLGSSLNTTPTRIKGRIK